MSRYFGSPPPTAPNGVLTPGAISTITNDTYYNAWPVICRNDPGDLLCAYTKAVSHHNDNTGNAVLKVSSDEGATWGSEVPIYSDVVTPRWSAIMGIATISTGRVLATLWRDTYNISATGEAGLVYSDDDGATWSSWIDLTNGFTQEAYGAGPVVELPGGDLLVTIEGSNGGQSILNRSCHTLRSTDQGATWGSEVTVANYTTYSRPFYESKLLLLDTGELICIHRCSAGVGTHYISRSSDQGATAGGWGTPYAVFTGCGAPSTIQRTTDTLVTVTRNNADSAVVAYASIDRGTTWLSGVTLDDTMLEMEYGCPVDLLDGTMLVVYGYQPSAAITNSDIKQIIVTEGMS